MSRYQMSELEATTDGETRREAWLRNTRNRDTRRRWHAFISEPCTTCGHTRNNVIHETDRENAPEGPDYYRDVPFCEFSA